MSAPQPPTTSVAKGDEYQNGGGGVMKWKEYKIGDIGRFKYGRALPEEKRTACGNPVYSSAGIIDYCDEFLATKGIIIGRKGNAGSIYFSDIPFFSIDTTFYIDEVAQGHDLKFFFHLLGTVYLENFAGDAAVPGLNREVAENLKIKLPPLPIQRRIADVLGRYDALIENYQRQIRLLEAMAQTLYREWFVRGRCPGAAMHADALPAGWERVKLGEVLDLKYGKSLVEELRIAGEFPVVGSSGIVDTHHKFLVGKPGIVVGRKGNVGSVYWVDKPFYPIDTAFYVESELSLYYLFFNLQTQNFISTDAAVPGLNREQALSNEMLKPADDVLRQFDAIIRPYFVRHSNLQSQITHLRQMRDKLLPRLMSGQFGSDRN